MFSKKSTFYSFQLLLFFYLICTNSYSQISVAPYTGIDYATNYTNPTAGAACGNMAGINASIGDADFVNGAAEVPLGWSFSGTWNSGLIYYDGPGNELLLVSLHTYTEAWYVSLLLSNGTTTPSQPYYLTLVTSNAFGSLNYCGGVVYGFNYERPSQLLDFANYVIPAGIGVIGIVFEPFADGAVDPDPHGVLVLQGTTSSVPCDTLITTNEEICLGDSVLFQGIYYSTTGNYTDSLQTSGGCDSLLTLNLTVNPTYLIYQNQSICQGESILLGGSLQTTAGIYTDSLQSVSGCDSTTITTLAVGNLYNDSTTLSICQGQSAFVGGAFQTIAGNYYDTLQTVLGCDSVITTNLTIIPIANSTITPVNSFCENSSLSNFVAATAGGVWSGNGIVNTSNGQFNPSLAGVGLHEITYTIGGNCGSADSINVMVFPAPDFSLLSIEDTCLFERGTIFSIPISGTPFNYLWSRNDVTQDLFNVLSGTYSLTVTDSNNCSRTKQIVVGNIENDCDVVVPNVITPNGDGMNDLLVFENLENFPNNHLLIFNRWGQKLYEKEGYQNDWNGTKYSDGTYFFILELNDKKNTLHKGTFTLFR